MFKVKKKIFTPQLMQALEPLKVAKFPGWCARNVKEILGESFKHAMAIQKEGALIAKKYLKEGETKGQHGEAMYTPVLVDGEPQANLFEGLKEGDSEAFKKEYEAMQDQEISFECSKIHQNMLDKVELSVVEYANLEPFISVK